MCRKSESEKIEREELMKIQLRYIRCNLASIGKLIIQGRSLSNLNKKDVINHC